LWCVAALAAFTAELPLAQLLAAAAPPSVALSGRLLDDRGAPFADTEITVTIMSWVPGSGRGVNTFKKSLRTDRAGRFSLEYAPDIEPTSRYWLELSGSAFMPHALPFSLEGISQAALGDLPSARRSAQSGRVLGPNGQPVAGARVEAIAKREDPDFNHPTPPLRERVETDQAGRFNVHVPPALDCGLMVWSDQGAVARRVVPAGGQIPAEIALERGATIRGRLVDRSGKPVRGCAVYLQSDDDQTVRTELGIGRDLLAVKTHRMTDAEGRFQFPPLLGEFLISLPPRSDFFEKDSEAYRKRPAPEHPDAARSGRQGMGSVARRPEVVALPARVSWPHAHSLRRGPRRY
jgi:uncharacterized GH25 family protein